MQSKPAQAQDQTASYSICLSISPTTHADIQTTAAMQPSSQTHSPLLPPDYTLQPITYPADTDSYLSALKEIFSTDPNIKYINASIKNPTTNTLRQHMRLARFRNQYEQLTSESRAQSSLYMKLIHIPTSTIAGACIWTFPLLTTPSSSGTEHPLLPPGTAIPPEDAHISTIGPAMDAAMERIASSITQLGSTTTRNEKWWYLNTLGVLPAHQGKRLGQAMVRWGVERAKADAAARPELEIRGVWVTASEAGRKTYENEGFMGVGKVRVLYGDGKGGVGIRFDTGDGVEGGDGEGGQMHVLLIREF